MEHDMEVAVEAMLDNGLTFHEAKRMFEREIAKQAMERTKGNKSQAARLVQKDRRDFYDLLVRTGLHGSSSGAVDR